MAGYMVYWSKEYVKELEKAGDTGPFKVVYGSQHQIMPSISAVKVGDIIYPVTIKNGTLAVMARLCVEKIECAFDYAMRELGTYYFYTDSRRRAILHRGNVWCVCDVEGWCRICC